VVDIYPRCRQARSTPIKCRNSRRSANKYWIDITKFKFLASSFLSCCSCCTVTFDHNSSMTFNKSRQTDVLVNLPYTKRLHRQ
jgi:hypothetical protein